MFTGLIEGIGEITRITRVADALRLSVSPPFDLAEVRLGDSIAVSGTCLTVVELTASDFTVEVSAETLARTTLSLKKRRDLVNLERALRLGDRLGGHLVTGHIDTVGTLLEKVVGPQSWRLKFALSPQWSRYVIEKGSIAVEGISLTVNGCGPDWFMVNIIPYTAQHTTIGGLATGARVNIETDIIGKYVAKLLGPKGKTSESGITPDLLLRHGFI
ncbi:MAG: riboflavin synthase [Deltaproteobacteria bacterium]|nr:riboflavin synthase [Deltaproteobacteria bacterium]MBW2134136.1 riboflavin synthase [Deltaproteobacteria bacterium]